MPRLSRGVLIALEGIDGSGKSTLASNLASSLSKLDFPILQTQEPGKMALGKLLKPIVQEKKVPLCSKAEFLLFAADRAQHFHELIIPALLNKQLIISDRMADSSLAYQGFGRGLDLATLRMVNSWVMENTKPDLVVYVKIPPHVAQERIQKRGAPLSSFEKERELFIQTLSEGFDTLFENRPDVIVLDGTQAQATITTQATDTILSWLKDQRIT